MPASKWGHLQNPMSRAVKLYPLSDSDLKEGYCPILQLQNLNISAFHTSFHHPTGLPICCPQQPIIDVRQNVICCTSSSTLHPMMVSVRSPRGEIHNLRLSSEGVSSKGLGFSLCRGLPMRSCLGNLLASR